MRRCLCGRPVFTQLAEVAALGVFDATQNDET